MKLARAKCPDCGRVCAVRPPRGGDGSIDLFPLHRAPPTLTSSSYCIGSRQVVDPTDYTEEPS